MTEIAQSMFSLLLIKELCVKGYDSSEMRLSVFEILYLITAESTRNGRHYWLLIIY